MGTGKLAFLMGFLMLSATAGAQAQEGDGGPADRGNLLTLPITPTVIVVCHGYDCLYRDEIALSQKDLGEMARLMRPAKASAAAERTAIAKVMAWFDRRVGPEIGTVDHLARAGAGHAGERREFDCIDTSRNTTMVLRELQRLRLLTHHRVAEPASRLGPPLHSTAVITDIRGEAWAVDGWTQGYGAMPDVMPLQRWMEASVEPDPVPPVAAGRPSPAIEGDSGR